MNPFTRDSFKWSISIAILTFILGTIFTVLSTSMLAGVNWGVGMLIVLFFVLIGILFDIIGLAAASGDEIPFRAMAAEKIPGAKQGLLIIRNAARVSSFCNDVIGDISGIVSGTATAYVVVQMILQMGYQEDGFVHSVLAILITSIVASLTVGGKAFGKAFAINYSTRIVLIVGKFLYLLESKLNIRLFKGKSKKREALKERG